MASCSSWRPVVTPRSTKSTKARAGSAGQRHLRRGGEGVVVGTGSPPSPAVASRPTRPLRVAATARRTAGAIDLDHRDVVALAGVAQAGAAGAVARDDEHLHARRRRGRPWRRARAGAPRRSAAGRTARARCRRRRAAARAAAGPAGPARPSARRPRSRRPRSGRRRRRTGRAYVVRLTTASVVPRADSRPELALEGRLGLLEGAGVGAGRQVLPAAVAHDERDVGASRRP